MRYFVVCAMVLSGLACLFGNFDFPDYEAWICEEESCGRSNDRDQADGCSWCEEREGENEQLKNEYYREVLDAEDPDGAPHTYKDAKEFEKSIQ